MNVRKSLATLVLSGFASLSSISAAFAQAAAVYGVAPDTNPGYEVQAVMSPQATEANDAPSNPIANMPTATPPWQTSSSDSSSDNTANTEPADETESQAVITRSLPSGFSNAATVSEGSEDALPRGFYKSAPNAANETSTDGLGKFEKSSDTLPEGALPRGYTRATIPDPNAPPEHYSSASSSQTCE